MKELFGSLRSVLGVGLLVALILGTAWWWLGRGGHGTSTSPALSPLAEPISPLVTPTEWPTFTPWVEPTIPPFPTPPDRLCRQWVFVALRTPTASAAHS